MRHWLLGEKPAYLPDHFLRKKITHSEEIMRRWQLGQRLPRIITSSEKSYISV